MPDPAHNATKKENFSQLGTRDKIQIQNTTFLIWWKTKLQRSYLGTPDPAPKLSN